MAMISGFHNSVNGDRRYLAEFLSRFYGAIVADGVYPNPSSNLQVAEKENMTTSVRPGRIWIQGHFGYDDHNHDVVHDVADGVLHRIDRIVARLDFLERKIMIQVKKGTFASSPVAPSLQRDADAWELALSDVRINAGTTYITQAQITDLRLNKELCGIAHGAVDQVDTTTLFAQYQSWIEQQKEHFGDDLAGWFADQQAVFLNWRADEEGEFRTWFDSIRDLLDEDAAGNLLLLIEDLVTRMTSVEGTVSKHSDELESLAQLLSTLSEAFTNHSDTLASDKVAGHVRVDGDTIEIDEKGKISVVGHVKIDGVKYKPYSAADKLIYVDESINLDINDYKIYHDADFLYAMGRYAQGTSYPSRTSKKIRKSDLSVVAESASLDQVRGSAEDNSYIYAFYRVNNTPHLRKMTKSTLSVIRYEEVASVQVAAIADDEFIYGVGSAYNSAELTKYNKTDLSEVGKSTAVVNAENANSLVIDNEYIYAGGNADWDGYSTRIRKVSKSSLGVVRNVLISGTAFETRRISSMDQDEEYLYLSFHPTKDLPSIVKMRKSNLSIVIESKYLKQPSRIIKTVVTNLYVYLLSKDLIYKLDKINLQLISRFFYEYDDAAIDLVMDGDTLYVGRSGIIEMEEVKSINYKEVLQ